MAGEKPKSDEKQERLARALKANLARRKAQGRARAEDGTATDEQNGPKTPPNGRAPENEE